MRWLMTSVVVRSAGRVRFGWDDQRDELARLTDNVPYRSVGWPETPLQHVGLVSLQSEGSRLKARARSGIRMR